MSLHCRLEMRTTGKDRGGNERHLLPAYQLLKIPRYLPSHVKFFRNSRAVLSMIVCASEML